MSARASSAFRNRCLPKNASERRGSCAQLPQAERAHTAGAGDSMSIHLVLMLRLVFVQAELRVRSRHCQAAAVDPLIGARNGGLDQLAGVRKIVRRAFQRTEWRQHVIVDVGFEMFELRDELARNEQSE